MRFQGAGWGVAGFTVYGFKVQGSRSDVEDLNSIWRVYEEDLGSIGGVLGECLGSVWGVRLDRDEVAGGREHDLVDGLEFKV